jgi:hypothetical protein
MVTKSSGLEKHRFKSKKLTELSWPDRTDTNGSQLRPNGLYRLCASRLHVRTTRTDPLV